MDSSSLIVSESRKWPVQKPRKRWAKRSLNPAWSSRTAQIRPTVQPSRGLEEEPSQGRMHSQAAPQTSDPASKPSRGPPGPIAAIHTWNPHA